jgi:hypothetical protein
MNPATQSQTRKGILVYTLVMPVPHYTMRLTFAPAMPSWERR